LQATPAEEQQISSTIWCQAGSPTNHAAEMLANTAHTTHVDTTDTLIMTHTHVNDTDTLHTTHVNDTDTLIIRQRHWHSTYDTRRRHRHINYDTHTHVNDTDTANKTHVDDTDTPSTLLVKMNTQMYKHECHQTSKHQVSLLSIHYYYTL